ncbi:hypothetical protein TB2_018742 [Malus domestica]
MMEQRTVAFGKGPTLCLSLCLCCCAVHILDVNGLLCLLRIHWVRQLTNLINGCTPSYLKVSARLPPLAFNPLLHGSASSACAALCSYACILLSTYACISLCSSWPKLEA